MALIQHWGCQDNAASTVVVATVGTNGTLLGGDNTSALSQADGPGTAYPRSLLLDGLADYIDFTASAVSFASGTAFSLAFWAKPTAIAGTPPVIGITGATTSRIRISAANTIVTLATQATFALVNACVNSVWQHFLVTRTAGNSVRAFLDGVESSTGAQARAETFAPTWIGRGNTGYYPGRIADVRVYNSDESSNVAAIMAEADLAGGAVLTPARRRHGWPFGWGD
jgi:hypothetical protein